MQPSHFAAQFAGKLDCCVFKYYAILTKIMQYPGKSSRSPEEVLNHFQYAIPKIKFVLDCLINYIPLKVSFMVNQLLDLVSRQRRDVIPKCGVHPSQDLRKF